MKKNFPYLILGLGGLGLACQRWLLTAGVDGYGLLTAGHPARILVWALSGVAVLAALIYGFRFPRSGKYSELFPASRFAFVGCCVAAAVIFIVSLGHLLERPDFLNTLAEILGILSLPVLIFSGWYRCQGKRPSFLPEAFLAAAFSLRLVCQYRAWSYNPQFDHYAFHLLAQTFLVLATYERGAFALRMGHRPKLILFSLCAVFFCCLAAAKGDQVFYWLGTGLWVFSGLPNPDAPGLPRRQEVPNEPAETP